LKLKLRNTSEPLQSSGVRDGSCAKNRPCRTDRADKRNALRHLVAARALDIARRAAAAGKVTAHGGPGACGAVVHARNRGGPSDVT
jgi:hypothetical protein